MSRRSLARAAAALTLALAATAAGCGGGAARFYALDPSAAAGGAALPARRGLGLAVGPLELPRHLDRPEIVSRDDRGQLVLANEHRWGGSLRSDLLRVVADDLAALLDTTRVVVYPAEPRFRPDYRVLLDVRQLEGALGTSVALRARWTIVSGADGAALAVEESRIEQPVASAAYADYVAAQTAAVGAMTRDIAARIATLAGAAATSPGR